MPFFWFNSVSTSADEVTIFWAIVTSTNKRFLSATFFQYNGIKSTIKKTCDKFHWSSVVNKYFFLSFTLKFLISWIVKLQSLFFFEEVLPTYMTLLGSTCLLISYKAATYNFLLNKCQRSSPAGLVWEFKMWYKTEIKIIYSVQLCLIALIVCDSWFTLTHFFIFKTKNSLIDWLKEADFFDPKLLHKAFATNSLK